jgi:holo-[acyl-carrier protein] synthase
MTALDLDPRGHRIGTDLVSVTRFERLLTSSSGSRAIFTPGEQGHCSGLRDEAAHLAARFAAKEASLKALGIGLGLPPSRRKLREIEVISHGGLTTLRLHGRVAHRARQLRLTGGAVTLTHSAGLAAAQVLFTSTGRADG